jgi:SAM-dependent methyltransferase
MIRPADSNKRSTHLVRDYFEGELSRTDLETQIGNCDSFELAPVFLEFLPQKLPILEAGCGSGRWVAWLARKGYEAAGLDWSDSLCEAARSSFPDCRFEAGDIRSMPFGDGEFGSILALGSIEHTPDGPVAALSEFRRVLRPGGIAIITVPHGGPLRRVLLAARRAKGALRVGGPKPGEGATSLKEARRGTVKEWCPSFGIGDEGWYFYQYHFSKSQMREFFKRVGFSITTEWLAFHDSGIVTHFGGRAGHFNIRREKAFLTPLGKTLKTVLPVSVAGHMLCYIVRKP